MNHPDLDLMVQTERRKDEMAAAAHYRLVKAVEDSAGMYRIASPSPLRPLVAFLAHGMAWLGSLLTSWSCRLQRYSTVSGLPEEQPAPCPG
jgi:hypothetical protein